MKPRRLRLGAVTISAPITTQQEIYINIRPVKSVYFFREGDENSLLRILRFVCTQWGGIRHLLVPVEEDGSIAPVFSWLIELHQPDQFISYLPNDETTRDTRDNLQIFIKTLLPDRLLFLQNGIALEKHDPTLHPLSTIDTADTQNRNLGHIEL